MATSVAGRIRIGVCGMFPAFTGRPGPGPPARSGVFPDNPKKEYLFPETGFRGMYRRGKLLYP